MRVEVAIVLVCKVDIIPRLTPFVLRTRILPVVTVLPRRLEIIVL